MACHSRWLIACNTSLVFKVMLIHEMHAVVKIVTVPGYYMRNISFTNLNIWSKTEPSVENWYKSV